MSSISTPRFAKVALFISFVPLGRNHKSIKALRGFANLSKEYLVTCIKAVHVNQLRAERCMINLYSSIFLDIDPLIKISEFQNQCFLEEDIKSFSLPDESGAIFFDNAASKYLKEDDDFLNFKKGKREQQFGKGTHTQPFHHSSDKKQPAVI
jgi:hypothetical protein